MSWTTRGTRTTYENAWIRVREDEVIRPDGSPGIYGVVEVRSPAVFVVPITDAGEVVMVWVDRYPQGHASLEIPAGGSGSDELLPAAQRELREETGLVAQEWRDLGPVYSLNGVAYAPGQVFLATGLEVVEPVSAVLAEQTAEGITGSRTVSFAELSTLIADGTITDNETLAALLKAFVALGSRLS